MKRVLEFRIVILFTSVFMVSSNLPTEVGEEHVEEPFPAEKCESMTNCSCYDYDVIAGVICETVKDFGTFSKSLRDGSIFEGNTTYEITISDIKTLPARSMEGLIVFRLFLEDPDLAKIEDDAFDGVMRLRRLHVRYSSIQEIPDFRAIKHSLRNLNLENGRLTVLDGERLQDLQLLETISFVNNAIRRVDPDVFKGTNNVIIFDISHNELTSLPENLLDNWKKLKKIVLSHNHLLHVDRLFLRTHPKFIYLDFNNITDVDSILHDNMTEVETLLLASNPIEKISNTSFNGKVPQVRFIYMDHCKIREFDVNHYKDLDILTNLDLTANRIEKISNQTIEFGYKLEIDFIGNQISEFEAEITYKMKRIYLTDNKLRALGKTLQFSQLSEVSVAKNKIQHLSVKDFHAVHGMANIELQNNEIQWIDRYTFMKLRNDLHYLDLSCNLLPSLNGSVRYLSQLNALNASNNLIQYFSSGEFTGLNELSELYLQQNRIMALDGQLQQLPQVRFLVISHNNIHTLTKEQLPASLEYIHMKDNPIVCDCKLLPFLSWLNSSNIRQTDVQLCKQDIVQEQNLVHYPSCPEPCTCSCTEEKKEFFLSVDCSSKNMSVLPSFLSWNFLKTNETFLLEMSRSQHPMIFTQSTDSRLRIHDQVLGINLENNSLTSVNALRAPPKLKHLYLANNQLRQMSLPLLHSLPNLNKVTLSGNPWECNCDALGFKKWILTNMDIVRDVNTTVCSVTDKDEPELNAKVISSLTDLDICPANIALYVSVSFGILTFLLLCAASKILYTKYELNIKVFLYSHGVTWVKEKDIDKDKTFDAFISFSHKDETFVRTEIISVIENKMPSIRLCLHFKHFLPGEFIHNNIENAVQNSKRTVLVLSRNFLESEWCMVEFRAAHVQALTDKVHRIIIIKLGDLPETIDPSIQLYLDSTTYLTWGEKYFWNNLLYVLPNSGSVRNTEQTKGVLKTHPSQTTEYLWV